MYNIILLPLITVSAIITIIADVRNNSVLRAIFKPLTTVLILLIAVTALPNSGNSVYIMIIAGGLFLSLIGDIALLKQKAEQAFLIGLIAFLTAHILYSIAFYMTRPFVQQDIIVTVAVALVALVIYGVLYKGLAAMKVPVLVYTLIIGFMLSRAIVMLTGGVPFNQALLTAIGALLFFTSDMLLAFDRFKKPIPANGYYILSTYYIGQTLIALSVHFMK
ncbi:MAG: lysoplasmalogenase [Spirochaetes bacterium]|nr:lysoplasmalogenase [Spirochaetota bacterium]